MALNAFWGHKEVIIVNETGCQLAKEIVKELREANFNTAAAASSFDYAGFADARPAYILVVEEDSECSVIPYKAEGFVGDRLGHHIKRSLMRQTTALSTRITSPLRAMTSAPTAPSSWTGIARSDLAGTMTTTTTPRSCTCRRRTPTRWQRRL